MEDSPRGVDGESTWTGLVTQEEELSPPNRAASGVRRGEPSQTPWAQDAPAANMPRRKAHLVYRDSTRERCMAGESVGKGNGMAALIMDINSATPWWDESGAGQ